MRYRRPVVQLTTLLDLLFIMIFVTLSQSKTTTAVETKAVEKDKQKVEVAKEILISGQFSFYATSVNPNIPSGLFNMKGTFDTQTGLLQLGGTSWVQRPEAYDMVPLKGVINAERNIFKGRIEFYGCEEFVLNKIQTASGSEIAGKWEGKYSCLQGETGLTLVLQ